MAGGDLTIHVRARTAASPRARSALRLSGRPSVWPSLVALTATLVGHPLVAAQSFPTEDPVLRRIWEVGMQQSRVEEIAQVLMDSIGPRLTGSPGFDRAGDWAVSLIRGWGVEARKEQYGTWIGWERGITHVDLISPRVRSLDGTMVAWSGGTPGPVEARVLVVPEYETADELETWLETVRGAFVAISFPEPVCRPAEHFEEWGAAGALDRFRAARDSAAAEFGQRVPSPEWLSLRLEQAGAAGILQSGWFGSVGTRRIHAAYVASIPTIDLGCEDYGLLWRLAENGQNPVIRVDARATFLGEVPVHNTVAEIRGSDLPEEYVVLSAHFDSWDAASGATDNGTGVTVMLEALRILREVYPAPRRTILLGLWGGEEQGLNGSRRFAAMHPEIVDNLQALFNQDTGTGRVNRVSGQGLIGAGVRLAEWISRVPEQLTSEIELLLPGLPSAGSSDHASFVCAGAPAFFLTSVDWGYEDLTWHTNLDTFDKIVFEDVRRNAVLIAMLAYLASEDPARVPRDRRVLPAGPMGPVEWPRCQPGQAAPGR